MKYTKGPWKEKEATENDYEIYQSSIQLFPFNQVPTNGNKTIIGTAFGSTKEKCEANAKLIAAAPDLLEALQEMLAAYLYAYTPAEIEARNTASDAIKKATE